jgi:hypothetical protein
VTPNEQGLFVQTNCYQNVADGTIFAPGLPRQRMYATDKKYECERYSPVPVDLAWRVQSKELRHGAFSCCKCVCERLLLLLLLLLLLPTPVVRLRCLSILMLASLCEGAGAVCEQ